MKFLWPGAFWFAVTIPVVVVFYLLKRKRVVRLVSSTLLWQKFLADAQANSPFQKLRHNWLLILQLLLLALAILALSRPYFAGHTTASDLRVVILDASASMQSTDEEPSRFEKARAEALEPAKKVVRKAVSASPRPAGATAPPTFMELITPRVGNVSSAVVELEGPRGRMKIEFKGVATAELVALSRALWDGEA